ncbi:hypothetical protein [Demequina aurantiaca]|uniref:hypothetical protein n=1 Tax=Demequina aurantiaca TaxID=676200 RepID=UPI003D340D3C
METEEPWSAGPFTEFIDKYVEEARAGDASQEQVDALIASRESGKIDVELVREAIAANAQCLEESGFTVSVSDGVKASGYVVPQYVAEHPSDLSTPQADALFDACEKETSFWLSSAYQLQPEARNALGAYVTSREPQLRECLSENGYSPDLEATGWELAMQALEVLGEETDGNSVDCLSASGIDGL